MQYFTFLGTGGKNGYREACTYFENEPEEIEIARYLQEVIYKKHADEISEVLVFITPEVKEKTFPELRALLPDVKITEIMLPANVDTEDFVKLLQEHLKQDGEALFDVTHSFRHLPMKFLFALRYAEQMKNTKIRHIYYGMMKYYESAQEECCITDVLNDYETQKISSLLSQFDQSLTAQVADWKGFVTTDQKVELFLQRLADFNEMLELCEFDACLNIAQRITETARSLTKDPDKYFMLLPLTQKISEKLRGVLSHPKTKDQKSALIRVLLDHHRFQNAVTFTDEFFREELIRTALGNISPKSSMAEVASLLHLPDWLRKDFGYTCSQYIRDSLILGKDYVPPKWYDMESYVPFSGAGVKKIRFVTGNPEAQQTILDFFSEVRNPINHGNTLKNKERLPYLTEKMLSIVDAL